jgi:ketosteroid isomerase-like protein
VIARVLARPHAAVMPSRERVAAFVAMIENGQFLESIPLFYAEDMTAQENGEPPRVGRQAQVDNERRALALMRFEENRAASYVVDGDRVAIHWVFAMTTRDGARLRMEEIAYQTWRGDRIVSERYFYDPAQRRPLPPAE